MRAKDIMTREVVSIRPVAPIREALSLMLLHRISGQPVIDADRRLVGIVTEADFLRRVEMGTNETTAAGLRSLWVPAGLPRNTCTAMSARLPR